MAENEEKKKQHKLLIEFIFRLKHSRTLKRPLFIVQNEPFHFGLKIKNYGTNIFPGATIKDFRIISLENIDLYHEFEKNEFSIHSLNPDEVVEVWWPDAMSTYLEGVTWVCCDIVSNSPDEEITTYQRDDATGSISRYMKFNKWGGATYIERKFELEQARTNLLILILTVLTFLEGLFGLKSVVNFLITQVKSALLLTAGFLSNIIIK